jgi:RNA polymerase sigma-B factor
MSVQAAPVSVRAYREADDPAARRRLIEQYVPLVVALARRYRGRGEQLEDLIQVGSIGLIKAVDRFQPERGVALGAFAIPTIVGEIKRHLRDRVWPVSVPRQIRESRRVSEFVTERPLLGDENEAHDALAASERAHELCEDRAFLALAFRALDERELLVLHLRFFEGLTQTEIGRAVGMSQIQVSRLLRRALEKMRGELGGTDGTNGVSR